MTDSLRILRASDDHGLARRIVGNIPGISRLVLGQGKRIIGAPNAQGGVQSANRPNGVRRLALVDQLLRSPDGVNVAVDNVREPSCVTCKWLIAGGPVTSGAVAVSHLPGATVGS